MIPHAGGLAFGGPATASGAAWLLACRVVLGLTLLVAGVSKLPARDELERTVRRYGLLPERSAGPIARWLPRLEVITGGLLLCGLQSRVAALVAAGALSAFTAGVVVNLVRGNPIDCGCFGPSRIRPVTWLTVVRNVGLVGLAVTLYLTPARALAVDGRGTPSPLRAGDSVAVVIAATFAFTATLLLAEAVHAARLARRASTL